MKIAIGSMGTITSIEGARRSSSSIPREDLEKYLQCRKELENKHRESATISFTIALW